MDDAERVALEAVDEEALVETVRDFVRLPSITGSDGESQAQAWVAGHLAALGCAVDHWELDLDQVTAHPGFPGWEVPRTTAHGVVGTWSARGGDAAAGHDGPRLVLNGHVDVVPPGDLGQWTRGGPFEARVAEGAVWGRGTCDMKGGLVCALAAVRAVAAAGVPLRGSVAVQAVVGEEDGGLGTFATLLRGHRGDAAIITEPTGLDLVPANAGALTFRLRVRGRSAHASVRTWGVDAVERFWPVWQALRDLETRRNQAADPLFAPWRLPYAVNVGTVHAGDWPSSVPDELVAEGRIGVALGEPVAEARAALEAAVAAACEADPWLRAHPVEVTWSGGQFASGGPSADRGVVDLVGRAHADVTGLAAATWAAPYGSDLRLLDGAGIPTLQYGPGDVRHAHAPDERVPIADLVTCTRTLVAAIVRFCQIV